MSELVIVACEAGVGRCGAVVPPAPEREAAVREVFAVARALLEPVGLAPPAPVLVLDARLGGPVALTVPDAAMEGLTAWAGRPAILFEAGVEPKLEVLLHELTHVWMRHHGADEPRWRLERGRATHESAVVHEGLADFVAAALTRDPVLYEGAAVRSVAPAVRCPDGLTGWAHEDAAVVSSALWELGGAGHKPEVMAEVLAAVARSAPQGGRGFEDFVGALGSALEGHATLASRWREVVASRGLRACHDPIALGAGRTSARALDFVAAGTERAGTDAATGPLHFRAAVSGMRTLRISGRSSEGDALVIDWQAHAADGQLLERGRLPLGGWPSQFATLTLPPTSHTLSFGLVTTRSHDVTYNDLRVTTIEAYPGEPAPLSVNTPSRGCALGGDVDLGLPLLLACLARRLNAWRRPR